MHTPPVWRLALAFYAVAFLSCLYISLQIEIALDRYTLPYAPFLAIMAGLTAQITTHAFRAATGSQPTTERAASP